MPAVVKHFAAIADGLDVASSGELDIALGTGINPATISFAGPGKSAKDLSAAVDGGVIIVIESERELGRVAALGRQRGKRPRVVIRVNPDFELKTAGMKMSGGPRPFGIDAEVVPSVLAGLPELAVDFIGLHIFSGSQSLRTQAIIDTHTKALELAMRLAEETQVALKWLNLGGGLGIPYFPGEEALDVTPIAQNLERLAAVAEHRFPGIELVIELGRYLVGGAGIYVCEITDRKLSRGQAFLITNGGLHHHLAASGNFGQIIRKNYPVAIGNRIHSQQTETVNIVGPLCTPLDILAQNIDLPVTQVGDLVVIYQSGAYGYSASPLHFLSHPLPLQACF